MARKEAQTKTRDVNKNKIARSKKAVKESNVKLADPTKKGLTPQEKKFCEIYVSPTEFYGNGTQSYIEAYNVQICHSQRSKVDVNGETKDKSKKQMTYNSVRDAASRLLTRTDILTRINELLEEGGFNDVFVDKQLKHLVTQHADPRVQLAAISEYNKLMSRIEEKKTIRHTFADDDTPEEELDRIIEEQEKHFNKT